MPRLQDVVDHRSYGADVQLQVALDNMPGALVYTDEDLNIVFCNDRFKEMYRVPEELLQPGRPYPELSALPGRTRLLRRGRRRQPWSPSASRVCGTHPAGALRTTLRTVGGIALSVVAPRAAARSR